MGRGKHPVARIGAAERREFEHMRERLVERMDALDEQVDEGKLSDDAREDALIKDFGKDWRETLVSLNEVIHTGKREAFNHHAPFAAAVVLVVVGLAALAGVFGTTVGFATLDGVHHYTLVQSYPVTVHGEGTFVLSKISGSPGTYAIELQDVSGTHTVAEADANGVTCTGCGNTYTGPATIDVQGAPAARIAVQTS